MDKKQTTEELLATLEERIPNLYEFYTKEEVLERIKDYDGELEIEDHFMCNVWDEEMRRCSYCGKLMKEGYYLSGDYACSDECRNDIYRMTYPRFSNEDLEKAYLYDYYEAACDGISLNDWLNSDIEDCRNYDGKEGDSCYYTEWY